MFKVCLDQRDAFNGNYMWVGVTTAAPDTLTMPPNAGGWESAVVINNNSVHECGRTVSTDSQERST